MTSSVWAAMFLLLDVWGTTVCGHVLANDPSLALVSGVDPYPEHHLASKLILFLFHRDASSRDLALHINVGVGGDVEELNCHQRLGVVHL